MGNQLLGDNLIVKLHQIDSQIFKNVTEQARISIMWQTHSIVIKTYYEVIFNTVFSIIPWGIDAIKHSYE